MLGAGHEPAPGTWIQKNWVEKKLHQSLLRSTKPMNAFYITRRCTLAVLVAVGTTIGLNQLCVAQQVSAAHQDGMEVLTRGPVHEAFAETITYDPEPGIVVPKAPPDPIEEVAPDQRPEGEVVRRGPAEALAPDHSEWSRLLDAHREAEEPDVDRLVREPRNEGNGEPGSDRRVAA